MGKEEPGVSGGTALRAGIWYVISSVMVKGIAVLTTPVFTRILSQEEYGNVATFTSWYSILLIFCTVNLTYSIGRAKLDLPGKIDDYLGSMTIVSAIISMIFAVFMLIFRKQAAAFMELSEPMLILLLIYLVFSPAISFAQNGFRYRYQYKQNIAIAWYTAISTVVASIVLIFLFQEHRDISRALGLVVPTVLLSVFFWGILAKNGHLKLRMEYCRYGIALSLPLVLHSVSLNILAQSDRIFISKIWGSSSTAVYSLAYSYGILISVITNAVAEGWLPWFHDTYHAGEFDKIRNNAKQVVVLGCYVGLACIALAPEAVAILGGEEYSEGIYCVPPIVLGIICQYVYTHYVNIELHLKKTKYVSIGTVFAAVLNMILNAIFIPWFGFTAAAYTTFAGYLTLLFLHLFITRRILRIKLYCDSFMTGSVLCTAVIAFLITMTYKQPLVRYGIILMGFISFLFVFRKYMVTYICKRLGKSGEG